jgi:hypothetical protein
MTNITIPAPIVGHLRCALLSELGDAGVLIGQASFEYEKEKHPELFAEPVEHFDAYRALLDVIAWGEPPDEQSMEIDLDLHRWALITALEGWLEIERDPDPRLMHTTEQREHSERNAREIEDLQQADRARGAVRPRAGAAPPARPHTEARQALPALPPARHRKVPALPRQHAGHRRRAQPHSALLLRHPPRQPHLRSADHPRRAGRAPARGVHHRLHPQPGHPRGDPAPPRHHQQRRHQRGHKPPRGPGGAPAPRPRPLRAGRPHRPEYMARRDAINTELATLAPSPIPDIDQARKVLEDFTIFLRTETDPDAKRQFLHYIFAGVWLDHDRIVAMQPQALVPALLREPVPLTDTGEGGGKVRERRGSNLVRHRIEIRARGDMPIAVAGS